MLNFTNSYQNLQKLFKRYQIHNTLKLKFQYQRINISIWYVGNLQNQISLICRSPRKVTVLQVPIEENNGQRIINTYLEDSSAFKILMETFEDANPEGFDKSTNHFFDNVAQHCNETFVVKGYDPSELSYVFNNNQERPFFDCFVRINFTERAKKHIKDSFPTTYKDIIQFCKENKCSVRFTADITHAHDVIIAEQSFNNKFPTN